METESVQIVPKNINSFDILKFLLAYCVIAIHCGMDQFSSIGGKVVEIAVPVYFVISGFLMLKNVSVCGRFKHYILKLVRLYITYTIIYIPLTVYGVRNMSWSEAMLSILQGTFIIGENYYSWPLWYLWSLIWGAVFVKLLLKFRVNIEGLFVLGVALVFTARFMQALNPISEHIIAKADTVMIQTYFSVFSQTRNGLFTALPYLSVGLLLAKYRNVLTNYKLFAIFLLPMAFVAHLLRIPFGSQLLAGCVVYYALQWRLKDSSIYPKFRDMSTLIYFLHMYVVFSLPYYFDIHGFLYHWSLSSFITTMIVIGIFMLSGRYPLAKKLYQ